MEKEFNQLFDHCNFVGCQYGNDPASWFQKQIRSQQPILYDHIPKEMNELNYIRCQRIPKRPGADWRDLPEEKVRKIIYQSSLVSSLVQRKRHRLNGFDEVACLVALLFVAG